VSVINIAQRLYVDEDGMTFPITNWIDASGEECEPENAIVCVAGHEGRWYSINLADFEDTSTQ
jgi:hypothetical protein